MAAIITVFVADTTATIDLIVYPSEITTASGPTLQELVIDESGSSPELDSQPFGGGPLIFSETVPNQLTLPPGVYFFATDSKIKYDITSGDCRVALQGGKNPLPPPPAPAAPPGTPLKTWESVYQSMYPSVVAMSSTTSNKTWIVVNAEEQPAS